MSFAIQDLPNKQEKTSTAGTMVAHFPHLNGLGKSDHVSNIMMGIVFNNIWYLLIYSQVCCSHFCTKHSVKNLIIITAWNQCLPASVSLSLVLVGCLRYSKSHHPIIAFTDPH
jgi:hypothetical protein